MMNSIKRHLLFLSTVTYLLLALFVLLGQQAYAGGGPGEAGTGGSINYGCSANKPPSNHNKLNVESITSNYAQNATKLVNDEDPCTVWSNEFNQFPQADFLAITLKSAAHVSWVYVDQYEGASGGLFSFDLQYFNGNDWKGAGRYKPTKKRFLINLNATSFKSVVAQMWRITNFKYIGGKPVGVAGIYEFGLYGYDKPLVINKLQGERRKLLDKAIVDECFVEVGSALNQYPFKGNCADQPKKNEAYVWGMTQFGDNLFYGTGANVMCLAIESFIQYVEPIDNRPGDLVCEFGENSRTSSSGKSWGDWRPPSIWMYNKKTGVKKRLVLPSMQAPGGPLLLTSTGIRFAGVHPAGIVFMGGPNVQTDGINLFAFNGRTGQLIGGKHLDNGYSNIRKMTVTSDGNLYFGFGNSEGAIKRGGAVGRWTGNLQEIFTGNTTTLFDFEIVAQNLDGGATELAEHDGRLYVSTWPDRTKSYPRGSNTGGIWMSPPLPLSTADARNGNGWNKVWSAGEYEPDPLVAGTMGAGALHSFGGWLYWGTMHVPASAYQIWITKYGEPKGEHADLKKRVILENLWREVSIFRGKSFRTSQQKRQLLYGGSAVFDKRPDSVNEKRLIKYQGGVPGNGEYRVHTCTTNPKASCNRMSTRGNRIDDVMKWTNRKNLMGLSPVYGRGGFGNEWNNYTWTMAVYNNDLYIGTMDHSQIALEDSLIAESEYERRSRKGGELHKIDNAGVGAFPVSINGLGNHTNYGFRTMVADEKNLYLGTANNANLNVEKGGWELLRVTAQHLD